jgi:hypothetical protein
MNKPGGKYQKAVEYLYDFGMRVQYRFRNDNKVWNSADSPSFLWDFVDYRIKPSELKSEIKFAKSILRARKWKHKKPLIRISE